MQDFDDTTEPGQEITGETPNSSGAPTEGPLSADLRKAMEIAAQKRELGRQERAARGENWSSRGPWQRQRPVVWQGAPKPAAPPPACETCGDKGYLGRTRWLKDFCSCEAGRTLQAQMEQEAAEKAAQTEQERQEREARLLEYQQIWEREQRQALLEQLDKAYRFWDKDTYPKQGNQKALRAVLEWVEEGNYGRGLGLVGPVGSGKTSLSVTAYKLVAPTMLEYPTIGASKIQFISVVDMFDLWRNSYDEDKRTGEPTYKQLFKRFVEARLLILDDLGAERPTDWTQDQLFKLIDGRARDELPTWFTTNCSLDELEQIITKRCYSRLVYRADVIEVSGQDLRRVCR